MRTFDTGATRDTDVGKFDYEGFLSPLALERFARYMEKHRHQADGQVRDSDNWQKGIPRDAYVKSGWRHWVDVWKGHRGLIARELLIEALCAMFFNIQGYLHELLKEERLSEVIAPPSTLESLASGGAPWRPGMPIYRNLP